jgi:hypothetical protein
MARRKQTSRTSSKRRYPASQIILYVISLIVVLGIAAGFVIEMLPTPVEDRLVATPTLFTFATLTPTLTQGPTITPTLTLTSTPATAEPPIGGVATPQSDQRLTAVPSASPASK